MRTHDGEGCQQERIYIGVGEVVEDGTPARAEPITGHGKVGYKQQHGKAPPRGARVSIQKNAEDKDEDTLGTEQNERGGCDGARSGDLVFCFHRFCELKLIALALWLIILAFLETCQQFLHRSSTWNVGGLRNARWWLQP